MLVIISLYLQRNAELDAVCDRHWDSPLIVALVATSLEAALLTYVLIMYLGMINQTCSRLLMEHPYASQSLRLLTVQIIVSDYSYASGTFPDRLRTRTLTIQDSRKC